MGSKWTDTTIGSLCTKVTSGGTPKTSNKSYYDEGSIPWLNTKEVNFGRIHQTEKCITEVGLQNSSAKWIPKDSVIVAMYGATAGKVAINSVPLTTNQACCNLIIDHKTADYRFVYYHLSISTNTLLELANGAAQQNLNSGTIKSFPIQLPPLPEQKAIAHILGSLDDKIDLNRRMNATLEGMAQALFKSWFVDFDPVIDNVLRKNLAKHPSPSLSQGERDLAGSAPSGRSGDEGANQDALFEGIPEELLARAEVRRGALRANAEVGMLNSSFSTHHSLFPAAFQQTESMGWIPEGWEVSKSGSVFDVRDGTHDSPKKAETGKHLITSRHITGNTIDYSKAYLISEDDFAEVNKRSKVASYDILLTMIGTVGVPFLILENEINFAIKNVGLFKTGIDKTMAVFFFTYLKSTFMTDFMESRLAGTTQKYLTLKILRELPLVLPDSNILKKFGAEARPFFEKIHSSNEEALTLTKLRDTLLPKLISGELVLTK